MPTLSKIGRGLACSGARKPARTGRIGMAAGFPSRRWIASLWSALAVPAAAVAQSPIDLDWARTYFQEAMRLSQEDNGDLWGTELAGPLLFVDRATRTLVANRPDGAGLLAEDGGVYVGTLPAEQPVANTAVRWAGRDWTMLVWPLPSLRHERRKLLAHEMFHRIQPDLGLPALDPANAHLGSPDGRIWLRLEMRALAEALVRQDGERRRALADALTFRARRHSTFPEAAEQERLLELNEGLAEYTGLRLSGLPDRVLADRAAVALDARQGRESLARSFAYATGPAYGVLLDAARVAWRRGLTARSSLARLAAQAYGIAPGEASGAEERAGRYEGDRVMAQERERAERLAARLEDLRRRFLEGPTLSLAPRSNFRYGFDPNDATPLPEVGTVYGSVRVTDEWGVLTVESGGALLERREAGIVRVVVPAPGVERPADGGLIEGDGWTLELADGWTLRPGARAGDWEVVQAS